MEGIYKESLKKQDTKGKYIFWDIDGTLAAYRYNGHVGDPDGTNNGMSLSEINQGIFLNRKPSRFMQNVVKTAGAKQNIIMSHAQNDREIKDKTLWVERHYPMMSEKLITYENIPKYETIIKFCNENKIDLKDVIFVDDVLRILRETERHGIPSYHISSFLDWEYED